MRLNNIKHRFLVSLIICFVPLTAPDLASASACYESLWAYTYAEVQCTNSGYFGSIWASGTASSNAQFASVSAQNFDYVGGGYGVSSTASDEVSDISYGEGWIEATFYYTGAVRVWDGNGYVYAQGSGASCS